MATLRANRALRALPSLCSLRIGMEAGGSGTGASGAVVSLASLIERARRALTKEGQPEIAWLEDLLRDDAWLRAWQHKEAAMVAAHEARQASNNAKRAFIAAWEAFLDGEATGRAALNNATLADNVAREEEAYAEAALRRYNEAWLELDKEYTRVKLAWHVANAEFVD